MKPVFWRPTFPPPQTPLTRRLLVYFHSAAYTQNTQSLKLWPLGTFFQTKHACRLLMSAFGLHRERLILRFKVRQ